MSLLERLGNRMFNFVHRNNLVYNTCWEDPRLDREALNLGPNDTVLVITSAGCNALDYALQEPEHVYAVDMNPRQNALLELKQAGIRRLEFETFFELFGRGHLADVRQVYRRLLRDELTPWARCYWDRRIGFFCNPRRTFYYRGASGAFARMMNLYIKRILRLRKHVDALLEAKTVEDQRRIYCEAIRRRLWNRPMRFAMNRDATLSMVGVPKAQRQQIERQYDGNVARYVEDCLEAVLTEIPLSENYFWRVYMTGQYTPDCCPEYLREQNFQRLRNGLVDRVTTHTDSVQGFLAANDVRISRFVLLDHMDWLSGELFPLLEAEWQAIVERATSDARIIWRSGGLRTDYVDRVHVTIGGRICRIGDLLRYNHELAKQLHQRCRVHTYGSFYIADLAA